MLLGKGPLPARVWEPLDTNPLPFAGLATSLPLENDYTAAVQGKLPLDLEGSLYRNGVGLYDRGGKRKRMLLDGDGMVQAFHFADGEVRYLNRFVRTEKFVQEAQAGKFLYPTWSTLAPGGFWKSAGGKLPNQAGTTVYHWNGCLYAFDEGQRPYGLDPRTLETKGLMSLDPKSPGRAFNAHSKIDPARGEWLLLSLAYGKVSTAHVLGIDRNGDVTTRIAVVLPRSVYLHDWFFTERHFVFVLHPAFVAPGAILGVMAGFNTYAEAIRWHDRAGNLVYVVPRDGKSEPKRLEAKSSWMWHAINAYESAGEIVADFVGLAPDMASAGKIAAGGLGTSASPLFQVMRGRNPAVPPTPVSHVRRYRIPLAGGGIREETLCDENNFELPYVCRRAHGQRHRFAYLAEGHPPEMFWTGVCRLDVETGKRDVFDFGAGHYVTEPVFVPAPNGVFSPDSGREPGWVLVQVYSAATKRSSLAVLDAEHLEDGPVAEAHLRHHVPMNFHGDWVSSR